MLQWSATIEKITQNAGELIIPKGVKCLSISQEN